MHKLFLLLLFMTVSFVAPSQNKKPSQTTAQTKVYSIGIFQNPPLSFINDKGQADGFVVDIIDEIALRNNIKIKWIIDDWSNILKKIKDKNIDIITSVAYSKERESFIDYSENSFIVGWSQVFLPLDSEIESFLDLNNKTIAILEGGANGKNLISRCQKFDIKCNFKVVKTYQDAFKLVSNGKVDATVSNNSVGIWYLSKFQIMRSSIIFNPTKGFIATPKNADKYFMEIFDKQIEIWKKDTNSFFYTTRSKWLSPKFSAKNSKTLIYLLIGLTIFGALAFLLALMFKRQVRRSTQEVLVRNQQFSQIINLVPHMIYVSDKKGNIILANEKANQYFGMTQDEIKRCSIENFRNTESSDVNFLNENELIKNAAGTKLKEINTTDFLGNKYTMLISRMRFKGVNAHHLANVTVAVDITDMKQFEKRIIHMAHYHTLTNLPNKTLFNSIIKNSIQNFKRHKFQGALLYVDLDFFKNINDSQGHKVGDLLINKVAQRFKKIIKGKDTVAHFGGDEFIIDLASLDEDPKRAENKALKLSELFLSDIAKPLKIEDMVFQITASMGIVIYPRDGDNGEILLQRADTAMNAAKQHGRNCVKLFDKNLEDQVKQNHIMETELRQAVEQSQFKLVYQPITQANTNHIAGAEALLRWDHPTKGLINPGDFIEIAEKIHLIVKIGYWVLEKACQKIQTNIQQGKKDFFIAVNVSVVQLRSKEFYDNIANLIQKYSIPPHHLELELTESVLMEDVELSINIFNKLKLLGIRTSIDDFGTGYSSFSYLIKLPIDKIKIDQSFVVDLPHNKSSATIVRTIIKMANELNIDVVAEGIETQAQYEFLIKENCKYFQGYHLHKPMEYSDLLKIS